MESAEITRQAEVNADLGRFAVLFNTFQSVLERVPAFVVWIDPDCGMS